MTKTKDKIHEQNLLILLSLLSRFRILNLEMVREFLPNWQPDFAMLAASELIHFWPAPTPTGAMQHLLALARAGALMLSNSRGCEKSAVPYLRPSELKRSLFTLEHTLAIAKLGLALEKLSEMGSNFVLSRLETSPTRIGMSVRLIRDGEFWNIPLVADAFFEAGFEGKKHCFLVEIDRGTTTLTRMRKKFIGYQKWWQERGPMVRFGTNNLRLLVFTTSEKRLKVLKKGIEEHVRGGAGFIWLSLLDEISLEKPKKLLSPIWHKAQTSDRLYSLFARPPGSGAPP